MNIVEENKKTRTVPVVSVGIPVHNGEKYIAESIESVLNQTYENFELIIINNASTDGTDKICRGYANNDHRIRYYRNRVNIGAARNFNLCFERARGEYFKWQAADEKIKPEFLEKCLNALENNKNAVLAHTRMIQINEYTNNTFKLNLPRNLSQKRASLRLKNLFKQVIGLQDPIWGLIRVDYLKNTNLIESFIGADDCLLLDLILKGPFVEVPEHLLVIRTHDESYHAKKRARSDLPVKIEGVEEARWYDPRNKASAYYPNWRRIWEYKKVVNRSRIIFIEKLRIYRFIVHLIWWRRKELFFEAKLWLKNKI